MKTLRPIVAAAVFLLVLPQFAAAQSTVPAFLPVSGFEIAPDVANKGCGCTAVNLTFTDFVPGHPDPLCAAVLPGDDCAHAVDSCDCVPDNTSQIAGIRSGAPSSITDPRIPAITALAGQVSRTATGAVIVINNKSGGVVSTSFVPLSLSNQAANQSSGASRARAALFSIIGTDNTFKLILRYVRPVNGINDAIQISTKGDKVFVQGPIKCPAGERVSELWVTVTQPETGAIGRDRWRGTCTGEVQTWKLKVPTSRIGKARFAPGSAHICAAAVFELNGTPLTADQWCNDVELFQ